MPMNTTGEERQRADQTNEACWANCPYVAGVILKTHRLVSYVDTRTAQQIRDAEYAPLEATMQGCPGPNVVSRAETTRQLRLRWLRKLMGKPTSRTEQKITYACTRKGVPR